MTYIYKYLYRSVERDLVQETKAVRSALHRFA
jgi:hypothetical protein